MKLNARLIDYKIEWNGSEAGNGILQLFFSNQMVLEITINLDGTNGNMKLSSPYNKGELFATLSLGKKQITSFELTKTYPIIRENGIFIKKFTYLKYWIDIKSKHFERKQIITKIKNR